MRLLRTIALSATLCIVSLQTQAAEPSVYRYTYIDFGYVDYDDSNLDGFYVAGSIDVAQNVNVYGGFEALEGNNASGSLLQAGVGYHHRYPFSATRRGDFLHTMDLWYKAGLERFNIDPDGPGRSTTENGIFLGVEARKEMVPQIHLALGYYHHSTKLDQGDAAFELNLQGLYEITPDFYLQLISRHYDNDFLVNPGHNDSISLGIRWGL